MLDIKATPERILRLLDTVCATRPMAREELIGAFCSHSEGSYMLDNTIDHVNQYLLKNLKTTTDKKDTEDTLRILFWFGVLRGSLKDILMLCN